MKKYIILYNFLNTACSFETTDWFTFLQKLDWIDNQAEILKHEVVVKTEEK